MYPQDLLKRRYIEKMWRDTAIRHGFEEIDGPTFEHLDLYTVKSGEGIVSELFSFRREGGEKDYALRPEFTPSLARMYAAKAGSLPKPTKWFWQQNCFRAEKPQRGRLREFGQWNVDVMGDISPAVDAEVLATCVGFLESVGITSRDVRIKLSHRSMWSIMFSRCEIPETAFVDWFGWLDLYERRTPNERVAAAKHFGASDVQISRVESIRSVQVDPGAAARARDEAERRGLDNLVEDASAAAKQDILEKAAPALMAKHELLQCIHVLGCSDWVEWDPSIVRGLAYYTGMVFEVHEAGGKERAIAGGGRYDKLIEMFNGPPTPAVGFGMGDVVLSLVLEDRGLMPQGQALLDKLSEPPASLRPDVFVISNGQPESDAALRPLVARLRRGGEDAKPLHARHSYKATKNIGKLLQEASAAHSRFAAIIENANEVTLKNLSTQAQDKVPLSDVSARFAR